MRAVPKSPSKPTPPPVAAPAAADASAGRPDMIVDFVVDGGFLFVVLKNIGVASAFHVVTTFDRSFRGLGGSRDISAMALFRGVEFVPPGKEFRQLVDSIGAYYARQEPLRLTATVTYADRREQPFKDTMSHNLEIYRDLSDMAGL